MKEHEEDEMYENVCRFSPQEPFLRDLRRAIRAAEEALKRTLAWCLIAAALGAVVAIFISLVRASWRDSLLTLGEVMMFALSGAALMVAVPLARTVGLRRQLSIDRRTRARIELGNACFYDRRTCEEVTHPRYQDYRRRSYVLRDEMFPARLVAG